MQTTERIPTLQPLTDSARAWVDRTLAGLSGREKIGQVLMPILFSWEKDVDPRAAMESFADLQVGGAFTFGRDWRTLREATGWLADRMKVPPLFSCDYECGPLNIADGARFGLAMTLAGVAELDEAESLAYEVGAASALQGGVVGARWSFAPMVDLSLNPHNPIVNTRSYGDDVERVRRISLAYQAGMRDHGMASTLKSFPGDGVDGRDQHLVTTVNDLPKDEWDRTYRRLFQAGIDAGADSVMMCHIALAFRSARDAKGRLLPGTIDPGLHAMLREEFGFDGLIVSDAINMSGLAGFVGPEPERALANLRAGSDIVLFVKQLPKTMARLERALAEGELAESRLDEAARRVLELKAKLGLHEGARGVEDDAEAERLMRPDRFADLAERVNRRSVTLVRDELGTVPLKLKPGARVVVCRLPGETSSRNDIVLGNEDRSTPALNDFEKTLEAAGYRVDCVDHAAALRRTVEGADAVVYTMEYNPEAGRGSIRPTKEAFAMIDNDLPHRGTPVAFVSFGSPYMAWEIGTAPNMICTYSAWPVAKRTAARALLGEIPTPGKLPVRM